jgi:hypothetical protein
VIVRRIQGLVREPVLHFLALGLLLFAVFDWRGGGSRTSSIVVSAGQIEHLASGFTRTWQRPPTERELKALIDEHVREELASREAVATGLDRDDAIVRRRLRQKLEFLVEDVADREPPTEAELQAWLDAHPDTFRAEPLVSFRQVLITRERHGLGARADVERLLARLRAAGPAMDGPKLGDPTALPAELVQARSGEVASIFGDAFARAIDPVLPGQWSGPIETSYGLHLVLVRQRVRPGPPTLSAVRSEVERQVTAERRRQALETLYRGLLARHSVVIDWPAAAGTLPATQVGR